MITKMNTKAPIIFVAIFMVAMSRLIPHWPNVTAVAAIAIFGGATLRNSFWAILIPLLAIFLSDLIINNIFYSAYYYNQFVLFGNSAAWIYAAYILITVSGHYLITSFKIGNIFSTTLFCTLLFFLLTNTGSWLGSPFYTQDFSGLLLSFEAGLPFAINSLLGNLFFVGVFFYGYALLWQKKTKWIFI